MGSQTTMKLADLDVFGIVQAEQPVDMLRYIQPRSKALATSATSTVSLGLYRLPPPR